jgi:outer membrane immunogenic protein
MAAAPMMFKAPVAVAPTWTSCYVGGNVGAAWDSTHLTDEVAGFTIANLSDTNIAGGQIGCDYQLPGNWVVGVQGMIDATALRASTTSAALAPDTLNGSIPWFATVTGRVGYAVAPNWLVYGKGGGAWAHTDANLTGPGPDTMNFDTSGWVGGGGVEWRVAPHWSVFAEYDYVGFPQRLVVSASGFNRANVVEDVQTLMVGVNLRFGN